MKKHIRIIHPSIGAIQYSGYFRHLENDDLKLSAVNVTSGPDTLASRFEVALAVPDTCAKAIEAEHEGVDALVIDCMGDVGCAESRECVSIPILGPYETSLHVAGLLSHKFAVVTMVDAVVGVMESAAKQYGVADKLSSIRAINMSVEEMHTDTVRRNQRLVEVSQQLIDEEGVGAIILGCAEMRGAETAVSESLLESGFNVPVIEPLRTTILIAAALVEARLAHSKTSFPFPQKNRIVGYDSLNALINK